MDDLQKIKPVYDKFSKNKHLGEDYKSNLVDTGNVDHIIPFEHSQNITAHQIRNLRPSYHKSYPKSAQQQIANVYFTNKETEQSSVLIPNPSQTYNSTKFPRLSEQQQIIVNMQNGQKFNIDEKKQHDGVRQVYESMDMKSGPLGSGLIQVNEENLEESVFKPGKGSKLYHFFGNFTHYFLGKSLLPNSMLGTANGKRITSPAISNSSFLLGTAIHRVRKHIKDPKKRVDRVLSKYFG